MRCPDCNKFVSFETEEEPEETEEPTLDEGHFTAAYRRVLPCSECGTELKEAQIEFDVSLDEPNCLFLDPATEEIHEWDCSDVTATPSESRQTIDSKGRAITNPRYIRTLYGVELTGVIKCAKCDGSITLSLSQYVSASEMDELV